MSCRDQGNKVKEQSYIAEVDGAIVGELATGDTLIAPITPGPHRVSFDTMGGRRTALVLDIQPGHPEVRLEAYYDEIEDSIILDMSDTRVVGCYLPTSSVKDYADEKEGGSASDGRKAQVHIPTAGEKIKSILMVFLRIFAPFSALAFIIFLTLFFGSRLLDGSIDLGSILNRLSK